ncbi:meiotic recombination protein spo11 [Plakobranchus ocellatus]|uniref:DNA topoisomerase (ATP-hydrolyzing) n=1 Tax=Plakobranchus ocellatus TaxID=259542 RepID=A0AAV4AAM7_9GAST|nr:meiotic recombination protein spo11 [Plakobranchus ocellatus]
MAEPSPFGIVCQPIPFIISRDEILRRIEDVCLEVLKSICSGNAPELNFPRHSVWNELVFDNIVGLNSTSANMPFTKVRFDKPNSAKKFATMLRILRLIYRLIQENRFCTKRDIFYQYPDLYSSQSSLDRVIDDVACMLQVPRWDLHILATSKGLVTGNLLFTDEEGSCFDCSCSTMGIQIPAHSKDMQNLSTCARFVLVVEKDATFQKLVGEQFCQKMGPCVLITGKGFPDIGTRLLLRQLWTRYHIPVFVLVDADPHGIEIMAVYKYGSMSQAYENQHLAIPAMHWLGILPEDISRLHIPQSSLIALTSRDAQKCEALKARPYCRGEVMTTAQINFLLELNVKAEIQCLDSISSSYLCDVYLPSKLGHFFK